jgi:replicative DNA helicase
MSEQQAAAAPKPSGTTSTATSLSSADAAMGEHLQDLARSVPIPLRFLTLERVCAPSSGRLWVIGGRPGSFKTGLVWNMAVNAAQLGRRVLVVTLEVSPGELALKAVARFSGLGERRIRAAFATEQPLAFTPIEQEKFDRARGQLRDLDLRLRLHGAANGRELKDVLESAKRHRYDAVFLDHVGMVGRASSNRDRFEILDATIDGMRGLTDGEIMKGYTPFVCMTTPLGRDREKERRKEGERSFPRMADFWGSSRLESDADAGIMLEKRTTGDNDERESPVALVEAFVVKNRHGPHPKVIQLVANGETSRVVERVRKEQADAAETRDLPMAPPPADEPEMPPEEAPEPGSAG